MALVPRWRYMTDEAKALTKRAAVSAGVVLVTLLLFRGLLPWIVLGLVAWWIWKAINPSPADQRERRGGQRQGACANDPGHQQTATKKRTRLGPAR